MGSSFWEKSEIKREEVMKNIFQMNELTKTILFMKKLKLYLIFELDDDGLMKRKSRKIIKVIIYDYNDDTCTTQKRKNSISMTIEDFYIFIFYYEKIFANIVDDYFYQGSSYKS